VLRLLCETPAEAISQALGQLSTGELRARSRHRVHGHGPLALADQTMASRMLGAWIGAEVC
jgi:hypothetical protein